MQTQAPVSLKSISFKVGSIASLLDAFKDSYKKKLRVSPQVFHAIDLNGSGVLGKGEFRSYMLLREGKARDSGNQHVSLPVAVGKQPGNRAFSNRAKRYKVTFGACSFASLPRAYAFCLWFSLYLLAHLYYPYSIDKTKCVYI